MTDTEGDTMHATSRARRAWPAWTPHVLLIAGWLAVSTAAARFTGCEPLRDWLPVMDL